MHYCVALCLFGIGPERSRTAYIRIGVKDANSKSSRCSLLAPPAFGRPALRWMKPRTSRPVFARQVPRLRQLPPLFARERSRKLVHVIFCSMVERWDNSRSTGGWPLTKRLYRVPEIVTRGRFPDGGESDSTWRTQEARHVGSDTIAPGF